MTDEGFRPYSTLTNIVAAQRRFSRRYTQYVRSQMTDTEDTDGPTPELLGYISGDTDGYYTVCTRCMQTELNEPSGIIRDSIKYGDEIPYPECYKCGAVMRP